MPHKPKKPFMWTQRIVQLERDHATGGLVEGSSRVENVLDEMMEGGDPSEERVIYLMPNGGRFLDGPLTKQEEMDFYAAVSRPQVYAPSPVRALEKVRDATTRSKTK